MDLGWRKACADPLARWMLQCGCCCSVNSVVLSAGSELASSFLFPGRLEKAQSTLWEVPAAGCDFPEEVISPKQMVLAQAARQDFGNWHCVMLSTGACHAVLIQGGERDAQALREVLRHASMQTPLQTELLASFPRGCFASMMQSLLVTSLILHRVLAWPILAETCFFQADGC